jgi:hypothetical protein
VKLHVFGVAGAHDKVRGGVVRAVVVFVVDLLADLQRAPKHSLHYDDVLKDIAFGVRSRMRGDQKLPVSFLKDEGLFARSGGTLNGAIP